MQNLCEAVKQIIFIKIYFKKAKRWGKTFVWGCWLEKSGLERGYVISAFPA